MSIFLRLNSCRFDGESETKFALRAGLDYRQWLDIKGGGMPRLTTFEKVAERLNISLLWLLKGQGPKDQDEFQKWINAWIAQNRKTVKGWKKAVDAVRALDAKPVSTAGHGRRKNHAEISS